MNRGKLVIVVMLGIGLALSSFAWWNRWSRSQSVIAHWGPDASTAIRIGDTAELLWLTDVDAPDSKEVLPTKPPRKVAHIVDISRAPGLIHARYQLLQEGAFDWNEPRQTDREPRWTSALRFRRAEQTATLLLDFRCQRAMLLERNQEVGMKPIATALEKFLQDVKPVGSNSISAQADIQ